MDLEVLKDRLSYDPDTGVITWKKHRKSTLVGVECGSICSHGYLTTDLRYTVGRKIKNHHIAWFLYYGVWPNLDEYVIDHINGVRDDNRIKNLRLVNTHINNHNRKPLKNCTSKYKGVWWSKSARKWQAKITAMGKVHWLGCYENEIDAAIAYNEAAIRLHGEYAYLNEIQGE